MSIIRSGDEAELEDGVVRTCVFPSRGSIPTWRIQSASSGSPLVPGATLVSCRGRSAVGLCRCTLDIAIESGVAVAGSSVSDSSVGGSVGIAAVTDIEDWVGGGSESPAATGAENDGSITASVTASFAGSTIGDGLVSCTAGVSVVRTSESSVDFSVASVCWYSLCSLLSW
jgi:hypothetical protein